MKAIHQTDWVAIHFMCGLTLTTQQTVPTIQKAPLEM